MPLLHPSDMCDEIRQQAATIHPPGADSALAAVTRCGLWCLAYGDLWYQRQADLRTIASLRAELALQDAVAHGVE